jgi:transposase
MKKQLEIIHPNAAGIDVGSRDFFVDAGDDEIRVFPTFTEDCNALCNYLLSKGIDTVAMESNGVYWIMLYSVLEAAGIEVYLVNGRDVKNLPGRKSDVKDCQWLRQLHSYGLLRKSFIPPADIRVMRSYMRLRQDHIRACATQVNLMQKALTQMNIRLAEVITDITGRSGLNIIRAILAGERNPETLLGLCVDSLKAKKADIILKSLQGQYQEEHLFALSQALKIWDYYNSLILECDEKLGEHLIFLTKDKPEVTVKKTRRKAISSHKPNIKKLHKPLLKLTEGKDPTDIGGITDSSLLQIISEVGTNMSQWPTEKHFTSWLKLAPMRASSGKTSKRITMKRHNKAGQLFRNLAQSIISSKYIALGAFGRRVRARRGSGVAHKAVARKIATYYYRVMTKGVEFVEQGIENYEKYLKEVQIKHLQKLAKKHNFELVEVIS